VCKQASPLTKQYVMYATGGNALNLDNSGSVSIDGNVIPAEI